MCADGAQWAEDRIASPQVHFTLAGLTDNHVSLPDAKRGTIASFFALASNKLRFSKVVALKGLPIPGSVRVWWTLRRRSKSENQTNAGHFRQLLSGSETLSENESHERLDGFGRQSRQVVDSTAGKAVRPVFSSRLGCGLGLISPGAGLVGGAAIGAVHSFLLERVMPKDVVIGFLSESHASLFKANRRLA